MKFLQCALCGLVLTVTASAQTASTPPPQATPSSPAVSPRISGLDTETVKGPDHPLTMDQMKVLFVALGYDKQVAEMDASREKMIAQNKTRNPYMPDAVWVDLDSSFKKIDYQAALYDVYKKYMSTEDAAKLIDFSKTEAGKDYFANASNLNRDSAAAIQHQQQQASQDVQARHKDEIEAAMKKYRDEHAPKQTPSGASPAGPSGAAAPSATPAPSTTPAKPATPPQN